MKNLIRKATVFALSGALLLTALLASGCGTSIAERREDTSSTLYVGEVSTDSFPTTFFPWQSRDGIAPTIASLIYNTLFTLDEETGEYEPCLAKEWCYTDLSGTPLVDENGKNDYDKIEQYYTQNDSDYMVVKLTLFEGATWSDGEPVTVEDVYYTLDIATDNALSGHAGALAWTNDLEHRSEGGVLQKQGMYTAARDEWGKYPYAAGEKDTVMYLHVRPVLGAVATLFSSILILPQHIWSKLVTPEQKLNNTSTVLPEEFRQQYENPVGCGAWTLDTSRSSTQMIVLQNRGTDYHIKDPNDPTQPLYKVDTIKFMLYLDQNTAIYALLKGYVDMLDVAMSPNYNKLFEGDENIDLLVAEGTSVQTLVMNVNAKEKQDTPMRTILKNKDVRKAIALAIDQESIIDSVLNGEGSPASAGLMLTNQTELYNPEADILSGDYEARVAQANEILDGIYPEKDGKGYRLADGKRIHFDILANPGELELVSYLQSQFARIGIEVEYKAEGSTAEDTYLFDGDFDMTFQATILNIANIDIMYRSHFVQVDDRSSNYGRLMDEELTAMIEQMRTSLNLNTKYELVKQIQMRLAESYYKVPVYASNVISVVRKDRFTGYVAGPGETAFNLDTLEVLQKVV